jgi:hypothetical protein
MVKSVYNNERRWCRVKKGENAGGDARVAEIERLIRGFREKFQAGTSDAENFLTMTEIERMWSELRSKTDNIYSDMLCELLSSVDEGGLIREKKRL